MPIYIIRNKKAKTCAKTAIFAIIYIMLRKALTLLIITSLLCPALFADPVSDQQYINSRKYKNNRLQLVTKQRRVNVSSSYGYTDIDTYTYTYEAYAHSSTDISTQHQTRSEVKEINEWFIYKGGVRKISDLEFLYLVGEKEKANQVREQEEVKASRRGIGTMLIGTGLLTMVGGAAMSAGQATVTGGALGLTLGFFVSAFNRSPQHYVTPDYAQEKIDEHNIDLKKKLGL